MLIVIVLFFVLRVNLCRAVIEKSLEKNIPASTDQIKDLAEAVCNDFFFEESVSYIYIFLIIIIMNV